MSKEGVKQTQGHRKPRRRWDKDTILRELKIAGPDNLAPSVQKRINPNLYVACFRVFGSYKNAIEALGGKYHDVLADRRKGRTWSKDRVLYEFNKLVRQEEQINPGYIKKNHSKLYNAIKRYYGNYESFFTEIGLNYSFVKLEKSWSKDVISESISKMSHLNKPFNSSYVQKYNRRLYQAAVDYFGSWGAAVEYSLGIDYIQYKQTNIDGARLKYSKELVIIAIKKLYKRGYDISDTNVRFTIKPIYNAALKRFGSWKNAVIESGIPYNTVRKDRLRSSYFGRVFEEVTDELLCEVGVTYKKSNTRDAIRPDYILPRNILMDSKLSEWSIYSCDTLKKYEPECKLLTIIYMRGSKVRDEMLTSRTRIMSVHKLIKQLPHQRQIYYRTKIESIETELNRVESGALSEIGNRSTTESEAI